jgi:hypothetical protein
MFYKVTRDFKLPNGPTVFAGDNIELTEIEASKLRRSGVVGNRFVPPAPRTLVIENAEEKKPKESATKKMFGKKVNDELVS